MNILVFSVVGAAAGLLSALLGVGGGIILVPAMTYMQVPFKVAVGTSLAIIIPTAITGTLRHHSLGNVDFRVAVMIAIGAIAGASVGAVILEHLPVLVVKRLFAVFMVVVAVRMFFTK